jgi:hypothetical protein
MAASPSRIDLVAFGTPASCHVGHDASRRLGGSKFRVRRGKPPFSELRTPNFEPPQSAKVFTNETSVARNVF